jgi:hypothetical protein
MHEDDTNSTSDVDHVHIVVVLSAPRGPEGTLETNANPERIRHGLKLSRKYRAAVIVSGHPNEGALLAQEILRAAHDLDIAAEFHIDRYAAHTVGNAFYALAKVRSKFKHWKGKLVTIRVVTSAWHRPRVERIFRAFLQLYRRHDPDWADFPAKLRFHSATPATTTSFTEYWSAQEAAKLLETEGFLEDWRSSPERFAREVATIKGLIDAEHTQPQPRLISSAALREFVTA